MKSCIHGYGSNCGFCQANDELENNLRREQRRYEIAKGQLKVWRYADLIGNLHPDVTRGELAREALFDADALLVELERNGEE